MVQNSEIITTSRLTIEWGQLKDRHLRGTTDLGPVWVRFGKGGIATGLYNKFGRAEAWNKTVPAADELWNVEDAKVVMQLELEAWLATNAIIAVAVQMG